jgi:hypothetical protein
MKNLLVTAAIGLLLSACGSVPLGAGPSPTQTVTVTENDHSAGVRVGQKIELALHARDGLSNWTQPVSTDRTILAPTVDPAATAAVGVTLAMFIAVKPGTVQVTSNASPKCPPNAACPMYVAIYTLVVTVTQ